MDTPTKKSTNKRDETEAFIDILSVPLESIMNTEQAEGDWFAISEPKPGSICISFGKDFEFVEPTTVSVKFEYSAIGARVKWRPSHFELQKMDILLMDAEIVVCEGNKIQFLATSADFSFTVHGFSTYKRVKMEIWTEDED